jgi:hypothetical protein
MSVAVTTYPRGRVCMGGCGTVLSIYNGEDVCDRCDVTACPPARSSSVPVVGKLTVAEASAFTERMARAAGRSQHHRDDLLAEAEHALSAARRHRRAKVRGAAAAEADFWTLVARRYQ